MRPLQQPALDEIERLQQQGVLFAEGDGTWQQRWVVHGCQGLICALLIWLLINNGWTLLMLPVVCLAIDLLSGSVHWFFDTRIRPGPTFLGRIAADFLDHHVRPERTTEVGFVVSAFRPAVMFSGPLLLTSLMLGALPLAQAMLFWIGALALYVPQTHKFTHSATVPALVRLGQDVGLILRPAAHGAHHANYDSAYCVFTGWANPVLDGIGFWRGLGRLCDALTTPRR